MTKSLWFYLHYFSFSYTYYKI